MKAILRLLFKYLFKTEVLGIEKIEFNGPTLIMSNHVSFLDPIILYAYLPKDVCFIVNTAIAKKFHLVLKWFDHLVVDPLNPYSLKRAVSFVNSGKPVVIFPEGRITNTGNLMKIYSGIGLIALKTNATIFPVILIGPELSKFSRMDGYLISGKGFVPVSEWYNCGDIISFDEDNFITIKSRLKRFAKISGEMVSLDSVESIATQCFGIEYNAAISIQDSIKGEKILLFTTGKDANKQTLREHMIKTGQNMLSIPSEIIIIDKLPLLGNGKTDYVSLRLNSK